MLTIKNRVQLVGNLGAAPEVRTLDNGTKMARFALATSDSYTNKKGEKVNDTQWHNIVVWGKLAAIVEQLLDQGSEVAIDGRLNTSMYTDKEGIKKYYTEIVASELLLLSRRETGKAA